MEKWTITKILNNNIKKKLILINNLILKLLILKLLIGKLKEKIMILPIKEDNT